MRSPVRFLLSIGLITAGGCASEDPTSPSRHVDSVSPSFAAVAVPTSITITADLTAGTVASPGKFFRLASLNSSVPQSYSVVLINGAYYAVAPNVNIGAYKNQYFLLPSDASFGGDLLKTRYGYFCGADWGWNSRLTGNSRKQPIPDGGTDRACLNHDIAWSRAAETTQTTTQRYEAVRSADRAFLTALNAVRARWSYETDYLSAAKLWMNCRVTRQVAVMNWTDACQFQLRLIGTVVMAQRVR
jgi:hypothetical protein